MYYTPETAVLAPTAPAEWQEQEQEFAEFFPGWEVREAHGERFLSEWDMPVSDEDPHAVSDEDWHAFLEMTYSDPAEG